MSELPTGPTVKWMIQALIIYVSVKKTQAVPDSSALMNQDGGIINQFATIARPIFSKRFFIDTRGRFWEKKNFFFSYLLFVSSKFYKEGCRVVVFTVICYIVTVA